MTRLSTEELQSLAKIAGDQYGVPVNLILAVIGQESGGRPDLRGGAGEYGLMQLMPGTADMMGFRGDYSLLLHSPLLNVRLGTKYLAWQLKRYNGDVAKALSAYNAGTATSSNLDRYVRPILAAAGPLDGGGVAGIVLALGAVFLYQLAKRS